MASSKSSVFLDIDHNSPAATSAAAVGSYNVNINNYLDIDHNSPAATSAAAVGSYNVNINNYSGINHWVTVNTVQLSKFLCTMSKN